METLDYWNKSALSNPYSAILDGYDEKKFWEFKETKEELNTDLLNKDAVFLDFGCGIGRVARRIAPLVKEYHGVDFSEEMIKKAREIYKDSNVFFYVNNGKDLSIFSDERFDVVFVFLVFQHIEKKFIFDYFKEIYRVLKPGGVFFANNLPKAERYYEGLTREEVVVALNIFKITKFKETSYYYNIECVK